jgi:cytochrome c-type biogenesis protein CcmF
MNVNGIHEVAGYQIKFEGIKHVSGPNYEAEQGQFSIYRNDKFVTLLTPERRAYTVQTMGMTEAGIDPGLFRDIYIALGDPLNNGAWAVRMHYKPFVRWIWLGAIFMAFGAALSIFDKRYRVRKTAQLVDETKTTSTAANTAELAS